MEIKFIFIFCCIEETARNMDYIGMGREPYCGLRYRYEYYLEHTFPIIPCNLPSSYKCLIESKKLK